MVNVRLCSCGNVSVRPSAPPAPCRHMPRCCCIPWVPPVAPEKPNHCWVKALRGRCTLTCRTVEVTECFLPSRQTVRDPLRSPGCVFSWCRLWSPSSRIREEQRWLWQSVVLRSVTDAEVRKLLHFPSPNYHLQNSPFLWQKVWVPWPPGLCGNTQRPFCVSPSNSPVPWRNGRNTNVLSHI